MESTRVGNVGNQVVPIDRIRVGERHRKDMGSISELAQSIQKLGLLQPLVITPDLKLIAGERRLKALKMLGREKAPVRIISKLEDALLALQAERDENVCRKAFTKSEAVAIGKSLEELEGLKAKERQEASRAKPGEKVGGRQGGENFSPPTNQGKTRDKAAAAVDMSGPTYAKAKAVVEAAEKDPTLQPIVEEMDRTGNVSAAHRKAFGEPKAADKPTAGTWVEAVNLLEDTDARDKKQTGEILKAVARFGKEVEDALAPRIKEEREVRALAFKAFTKYLKKLFKKG